MQTKMQREAIFHPSDRLAVVNVNAQRWQSPRLSCVKLLKEENGYKSPFGKVHKNI